MKTAVVNAGGRGREWVVITAGGLLIGILTSLLDPIELATVGVFLIFLVSIPMELVKHGVLALLLALGYVAFGNPFAKLHVTFSGLPLYVGEAVLLASWVILFLSWLVTRGRIDSDISVLRSFLPVFGLWYVFGVISLVRGLSIDVVETLRQSAMVYYSVFFFFVPLVLRDLKRVEYAVFCFLLTTALLVIPTSIEILTPGLIPFLPQLMGVAGARSTFFGMAIFLEILLLREHGRRFRWGLTGLLFWQIALIVLEQVRSVWVGMAAAIVFMYLLLPWIPHVRSIGFRLVARIALSFLLLLVGLFAVAPALVEELASNAKAIVAFDSMETVRAKTAMMRVEMWQDAAQGIRQNLVWGIGFGTPFYLPSLEARGWTDPSQERAGKGYDYLHNTHITVLLRMGLLGFFAWSLIVWKFLKSSIRSLKKMQNPRLRVYITWVVLSAVLVLVASSGLPLLETPYVAVPFWLLLGLGLAILRLDSKLSPSLPTSV